MRVFHVLLLLAATFIASSVATPTAITLNQIQSDVSTPNNRINNRFLRSQPSTKEDEDEAATDDEERISVTGIRKSLGLYNANLKPKTFQHMLDDTALKAKMFAKWDKYKVPIERIERKMYLDYNPHFKALLQEYKNTRVKPVVEKVSDAVKKASGGAQEYTHVKPVVEKVGDSVKKASGGERKSAVTWDLSRNKLEGEVIGDIKVKEALRKKAAALA
ncbi:hypothetical protein PHYBOEH_000836 [Phytophthora boehmeriae]|uniref:RxLR effector protein n=1 Tax=Phytophthora boehmeriae TaxID=109152 RepID=A0A8T1V931_9STRA|nr:hypothetical protein PHYBOEH_000836 [Phytophthora boehmeriae]